MMSEPVVKSLEYISDSAEAIQVSQGSTTRIQGIPWKVKRFLSFLATPAKIRKQTNKKSFSREEFIRGWEKAKERTAAGPSKLHFGHYKVAAQSQICSWILWRMAAIPLETGYSPRRWRSAMDIIIPKKEGVLRANKTRIIVLYEADFNFCNKWIGKIMMHSSEKILYWRRNNMVVENRKVHKINHGIRDWLWTYVLNKKLHTLCVRMILKDVTTTSYIL